MPWEGVTVSEARERLLEDWKLNYYSKTELAERHSITRKTVHKWIDRFEQEGLAGYHEHSRRPHHSPAQTDGEIVHELVELRKARPNRGPAKLLDQLQRRHPDWELPSVPTVVRILAREGLVRPRRRHRRAHPGCPKTVPQASQRYLGGGLQGAVSAEERAVLLSPDGERPGEPLLAWGWMPTRRCHMSSPRSTLSGCSRPMGCRIGFGRTTECLSPRMPWQGYPSCRRGSSSLGSIRS